MSGAAAGGPPTPPRTEGGLREYVELGQAPYRERHARLGEPNYRTNALRECQTYIQAIRNYLGYEPAGAELAILDVPQEAGAEYFVVCLYDHGRPAAAEYARRAERQAPQTWAEGGVRCPSRVGPGSLVR